MKGSEVNNRIHTWLPQEQNKADDEILLISHFEVPSNETAVFSTGSSNYPQPAHRVQVFMGMLLHGQTQP